MIEGGLIGSVKTMHRRSDLFKTLPGSRYPFGVRLEQRSRVGLRHAVTVAIHSHAAESA